jgi:hypothetical protein
MKLQAYILNGKIINVEIFNWSLDQLNGNKPWIVSETLQNGYADISSIESWNAIGFNVKDYLYVRNQVNLLLQQIGFNNLSLNEKIIVSQYFLVSKSDRDTVMSEEEQVNYWNILIENSQDCRFKRWETAKKYISYKLLPVDSSDLAKSTSELCTDYINYNIITKIKDGISGLFDYLKGEGDYVSNGYPIKSYWSQQDQDKLMDILENGNY